MQALYKLIFSNKQYSRSLVIASAFMFLAVILNLFQPKLIEWAIDRGISAKLPNNIIWGGIGILVTALAANIFIFTSGYQLINMGQNLGCALRNSLFGKVLTFSFSKLDKWRTGELLVRMNTDVNTLRMFVRMGLFMIIQSVLMILGGLVMMLTTDVTLALMLIVAVPVILGLFLFISNRMRPLFLKVREQLDKINNILQENLAGAKVVRAYNRQKYEVERFEVENSSFFNISYKTGYFIAMLFPFLFFIGNLLVTGVFWFGGRGVIEHILLHPAGRAALQGLTLGKLIAFNNYILLIMFPIFMLGMVLNYITMASAAAGRIDELLQEQEPLQECDEPVLLQKLAGKIEFKDVSFRYGAGEKVLDHINLVIRPGEKVGIIGPTGSGKSTLMQLIPRLYDPESGNIFIDDVNVKKMSFRTLRTRVAMVLQETLLFSGSISDNIKFGDPGANDEDIAWMAHMAVASEFIVSKPNGWSEILYERGKSLSGGQRQRLAIARALIADPDILILDDATSSVDLETERKIMHHLCEERAGKTMLIISQKINAVREANRILVFENGRVSASGTHDELMATSRIYRDIAASQSAQLLA